MAKKQPADPFTIKLTPEKRSDLAIRLCEELQAALDARGSAEVEVDYWWQLYEQARTRMGKNAPWPDAADLTSYLACEKVDAIHARGMRTIWVDPVWTVEGIGESAQRAPFVEEFHQSKAEEERLQSVIDRWFLTALVEPRGLLEVYEDTSLRVQRKDINARIQTAADPLTGMESPVFDQDGNPLPLRDERGTIVQADPEPTQPQIDPMTGMPVQPPPSMTMTVDSPERVRTGPNYRILPYRDSIILPGHARERSEIWAYGKRIWQRMAEIRAKTDRGIYDKAEVARLTDTTDKEPDAALQRSNQDIAQSRSTDRNEKELWELLVLLDLDGRGERWYLATLHLGQQLLLRLQHDDLERSRFVPVILFPRPDRATEGFSLVGHKLITHVEEHTAWRNMAADREAMILNAPLKRLTGALWDPMEQPWGPRAVIDVRDMREIEPVQVPENTRGAFEHIQMVERNAERAVGVNDISSGSMSTESRTLGEQQMATGAAEIRMDLIVKRMQEALEDLFQIRHAIWKRVLAEQPDGVDAPQSLMVGLEARGMGDMMQDGKITAALLEGSFRGKPRGSVETADPMRERQNAVQLTQMIPAMVQGSMAIAQMYGPLAQRAYLDWIVRLFRIPNRQAFLQPAQQMVPAMPGMPGMIPPMPGMPGQVGAPAPPPMMPQGGPMMGPQMGAADPTQGAA